MSWSRIRAVGSRMEHIHSSGLDLREERCMETLQELRVLIVTGPSDQDLDRSSFFPTLQFGQKSIESVGLLSTIIGRLQRCSNQSVHVFHVDHGRLVEPVYPTKQKEPYQPAMQLDVRLVPLELPALMIHAKQLKLTRTPATHPTQQPGMKGVRGEHRRDNAAVYCCKVPS